jgi:CubicO group peptidase (beta-lactamase class C family)
VEARAAVAPAVAGKDSVGIPLEELLEDFKVPAVSIAIIDHFQIVAVKAYGTLGPGDARPATTKTLFQAGTISEAVTAAAALSMVEHGQLSLDTNVNDTLKSWKVPDNNFTEKEKVTLRRLMSHTAGTSVEGFTGYNVYEPTPGPVQVLNGEKPANTPAVRVVRIPGTAFQYSSGGVMIEQLLMTDVTGKPFAALMQDIVLSKLGMADSTYDQPLFPARAARAATGAFANDTAVPGKWKVYPEMAATGLWTTPSDLASFVIEIAESRNGRSNKILSQPMATAMLTPVVSEAALGFFIDFQNPGIFAHSGSDQGFQCTLTMNYETGNGAVIMTNSDHGIFVAGQVMRSIAREFGWSYKKPEDVMSGLYLLALSDGSATAIARYDELAQAADPARRVSEATLNFIGYLLLNHGHVEDAIAVFAHNVEQYPNGFNTYDSLGEAYMRNGQKELAIKNYEKSLQLEPRNTNAVEMLKKLHEMK